VRFKPYPRFIKELLAQKSTTFSKAQALSEMGMAETTLALWISAASFEERIAPQLDILGRELEAAVHRISAASCYQKGGDASRAANLYRAALAGTLSQETRQDVQKMLSDCLAQLARSPKESVA
jgi:hypothetical protein